jgi:two-component system nitrogen regulation sensor histidine kinase NtrY
MSLRRKFLFFVLVIHLTLAAMAILLLTVNKYAFAGSEVLLVISLVVSIHLYRSILKPLGLIAAGIETIKDRDFGSRIIETGQDELDQLIRIYNRMIDELRSERIRQREQHYFLHHLIEASPSGIIILDLDNRIEMMNRSSETILDMKMTECAGKSLRELDGPIGKELSTLSPGESRIVSLSGIQTFRCRKSSFVDRGKVIRMMSHEINNSVGAVNSIMTSFLNYREQLCSEDKLEFEDAIGVAVDRNNGLNKFMSNLADVVRIPQPSKQNCDIIEVVKSVQVLVGRECSRRHISWIWELDNETLKSRADVHQIEQALLNIVRNSIEAIERDGSITIKLSRDKPHELSIIDTGKGIENDSKQHLFTPFYSTKKDGQGIGLTLIREILINHGFRFNLTTNDSSLTEFWVDFDSAG